MKSAPVPGNEGARLAALRHYDILDTPAEPEFDDFTRLAALISGTPIALISLVDAGRQWFKSKLGLEAAETPRSLAFCAHAIHGRELMEVPDARADERFFDNPLVAGDPNIRFYAGAPLITDDGLALGTLCVIDEAPRRLTPDQREALSILGRQVLRQMDLRLVARHERQLNAELADFAHVVSHDLKAPLRGIASLAGWLAEDQAERLDDAGREQLTLMGGRVQRMNALIDGILAYSRAGRSQEARVAVDLEQLVPNVIEMLSPPPHIAVAIDTPLPTVFIEPTRIQQVFQNLIANALKYHDKPKGVVRVACAEKSGSWRFSVADDGPGISSKYFDRIFQLFQTLAPRDKVEGTGVGLALVKKIVELEGGRVWVESSPGAGATFHFTLGRS